MNRPGLLITALALVALCIYLFVSAPPPLESEDAMSDAPSIPVETVLRIVAAENDLVRGLYTRELVGKGPAVGLKFDEFWRDETVEAGPLPALFLREAAASLQRSEVPLSLFLGSDFPISPSNRFVGTQAEKFEAIKLDRQPRFFYAEDTGQHTAMFPDFSSVQPCVSCHNEHPNSPKTDWKIDDVMGATTWAYPRAAVDPAELIGIIRALRKGFREAYTAYLDAARDFERPPEIGEHWPEEGYFLPSADVFMAEFERQASAGTMNSLLATSVSSTESVPE